MPFKKRLTPRTYSQYMYERHKKRYDLMFEAFGYKDLNKYQKVLVLSKLFYNFWSKSIRIARKGHPISYYSKKTKHRGDYFYFWMGISNQRRVFYHNKKNI